MTLIEQLYRIWKARKGIKFVPGTPYYPTPLLVVRNYRSRPLVVLDEYHEPKPKGLNLLQQAYEQTATT